MTGGFDAGDLSFFTQMSGELQSAAAVARGTTMDAAIIAGAEGLGATATAAALHDLAQHAASEIEALATQISHHAHATGASGRAYDQVDDTVADTLRGTVR